MSTQIHRRRHANNDVDADDPEPGQLPVEPDEGPVVPQMPENPEDDRVVDPEV